MEWSNASTFNKIVGFTASAATGSAVKTIIGASSRSYYGEENTKEKVFRDAVSGALEGALAFSLARGVSGTYLNKLDPLH